MTDQNAQDRRRSENRLADAKRRDYKAKQFIFRERETGDQAFIIMDGKVEILKTTEQGLEPIAVLEKGAMFGEMALIDNEPRMATARVTDDGAATLLIVSHEIFQKKLSGLDPFTRGLIKILADNVRDLSKVADKPDR